MTAGKVEPTDVQAPEAARIRLLVERDGLERAREWVERTLGIYRSAVANPRSYAASSDYRPRFEASIAAFESWLEQTRGGDA